MWLTRVSVTRPLAMLMFICGLVIMGLVARGLLRVDRFPNISFPWVNVSVSYPGAAPEDVETYIVKPIEQAVSGIAGVFSISAVAREGRGVVNIQLVEGADADKAAIDVERRVAAIRSRLPQDVDAPTVNKADPNAWPIMNIAISGPRPLDELYQLASEIVQPQLQSILGVADVALYGGLEREIQLRVDYAKLDAYGLSLQQVTSALARENISGPAGTLDQGRRTISVRSMGLFQSPQELNNLIVATTPSGPVYLRNVATVADGYKKRTRIQRFNGAESVGLSITKQSDANTLEVATAVRQSLARIEQTLPPDVRLTVTNDSSRFIQRALDAIQRDLLLAAFLCGLVLLVFLHTWRNTVIVMLAIPTSLISTFLVMYALGFSLNLMTMMALAIMIGILVDDAIVVLENIHRHFRLGEAPMVAALKGRSEIGLAAIAITLVDIVVYLPVAFMQGNMGRLFKEYALTIAAAALFSLFISFTLTPMLASRWLKVGEENSSRGLWGRFTAAWEYNFERMRQGYGRLLGWSLHHRLAILAIGALALGTSLSFIPLNILSTEYVPQEDDNQFSISVQLPPGTTLETTAQAIKELEVQLSQIPEVSAVFSSVGGGGFFGGGGHNASVAVQLVDKTERSRSVWEIMNQVRRFGRAIPEMSLRTSVASPLGGGMGGAISIRVLGDDLDILTQLSSQIKEVALSTPGIVGVVSSTEEGVEEVRFVVNRERLAALGVSTTEVAATLRTIVQGTTVSKLRPEGQPEVDITVIGSDTDPNKLANLAAVPLLSTKGGLVRLGQVAQPRPATSPAQIQRSDRQRVVNLTASVAGRPIGDVARDLRQGLRSVPFPAGYRTDLRGQAQQLQTAFAALIAALSLSVLLIYMLLVALYESWLYPLAIMFSLPVALVGAFGALLLTGNTVNIFSMIGMIMLMGLVAKNAILLVDYTNTLRSRGVARYEAIVEAGRTRLRPILMTTFTLLFALLPLALKFEAGAESRAPLAVVVMGGTISSTLLTLVLVPVVYTLLDDLQARLGFRYARQPALAEEATPAPAIAGASNNNAREES